MINVYVLVRGSCLFSAGALADRLGRRRVFRLGLGLFGLGSLLCSVAPTAEALIAFRVLQGLGGALLTPSSLALIVSTFTQPAERMRALGIWSATAGASTALGPVLGGALVQSVGWRSVFWIGVPVVVVALVLTGRVLDESRAPSGRRLDVPGQLLIVLVLSSLSYGLIRAPAVGWGAPATVATLAISAVGLVAFIAVERAARDPLLDLRACRSPPFAGAMLIALSSFMAFSGFLFLNTLYLQQVRGASPLEAALTTMPAMAGSLLVAQHSARMTARRGPRIPVTTGLALMAVGLVIVSGETAETPLGQLLAGYACLGLGFGHLNPPITSVAIAGMPPSRAGVAGATTSTARQIGAACGIALLGSIAFTIGVQGAYLAMAALTVFGLLIGARVLGGRAAPPHPEARVS